MKPISIVIPCYNEAKRLVSTIETIKQTFKGKKYELIIVDDGSTDTTKQYLELMRINHISYIPNMGKGYAVYRGLLEAKHRTIFIVDADLSVHPEEYIELKKPRYMIIGKRYQVKKQPLLRRFVGFGFRNLVRIMFLWSYKDTQCPYKILCNIPKKLIKRMSVSGFAYDVELIQIMRKANIPVLEYPVRYFDDPKSTVTFKKARKMLWDLIKIRLQSFTKTAN